MNFKRISNEFQIQFPHITASFGLFLPALDPVWTLFETNFSDRERQTHGGGITSCSSWLNTVKKCD